jgi:hypothetical protein
MDSKCLRRTWERICGTRLALVEAQNGLLAETNSVLEEELAAARREIRTLENSLLSGAGVSPLPPVEEVKTKKIQRIRRLSLHQRQKVYEAQTAPKKEENGRSEGRIQ